MKQLFLGLVFLATCSKGLTALLDNGNEFYSECDNYQNGGHAFSMCIAYAYGIWNGAGTMAMIHGFEKTGDLFQCTPPDVTNQQLLDVALKYMRDNPAERHRSSTELFLAAWLNAWPCPAK